ncbi:MAG: DegQ family serine endoprotease [Desulfobulbaceae bacterium]|nr:DegQ family serine endoprotease [Desulfobulbaceae bacterium]
MHNTRDSRKSQPRVSGTTIIQIVASLLILILFTAPLQAQESGIDSLRQTGKAFASVAKKVSPAVVFIQVKMATQSPPAMEFSPPFGGNSPFDEEFFRRFFGPSFPGQQGQPRQAPRRHAMGQGSGFIVSTDGYILTNNHVVNDAEKITVKLQDGREFTAKTIGTDPHSDVALIKIDAKGLPMLTLGDSDALEVGEWVVAIGSPFGLSHTLTVGVVSAKGRSSVGLADYENFIQTDAAINPGNSGGPLLNIRGEAIGINTAIFSRSGGYMGIGFAIPINMAKNIEQQLLKHGKVTRGWLGVMIQDVDKDLAKSFDLDTTQGVLISGVTEKSPAEKSGMKQGDVIIAIDEKPLANVAGLRNAIAMTAPETKIILTIIRDGKERKLPVTIGEQPSDFGSVAKQSGKSPLGKMGLSLQDLTPELADQFGYRKDQGVLIAGVEPDSPAGRVGLQAGQLIEEVNKTPVKNLNQLQQVLAKSKNPEQVLLRVRAGEYSQYVVLRAE